jgi:endonuclease YncB( thermonuclease family)
LEEQFHHTGTDCEVHILRQHAGGICVASTELGGSDRDNQPALVDKRTTRVTRLNRSGDLKKARVAFHAGKRIDVASGNLDRVRQYVGKRIAEGSDLLTEPRRRTAKRDRGCGIGAAHTSRGDVVLPVNLPVFCFTERWHAYFCAAFDDVCIGDEPMETWSKMRISAAAIVLITVAAQASAEGPLIGRAAVVDGDTIEIRGERVRFNGIDAPESWQTCQDQTGQEYRCGTAAAAALDGFLALSRPTRCDFIERDRYNRFVGDCYRADGESVATWMVRSGHALDWLKYSNGAYASAQAMAEREKRGMWQGKFIAPWDARKR